MVFSKLRSYCEALLREGPSARRILGSKQDNWPLTALECFSGESITSVWLRARTQNKKCLRILSNYADLHANTLLNDLASSSSSHGSTEEALAALISIVSWAPSMMLRVNTIGRLLYLPLWLLGVQGGSENSDSAQQCKMLASCCRLIHVLIKFRGNQCRRSAALVVQNASCLQSSLFAMECQACRGNTEDWRESKDALRSAASYMSDFYKDFSSQGDNFGKYLVHMLSAYIMLEQTEVVARGKSECAAALESGVCILLGSCLPKDLKHLHTVFLADSHSGKHMEKLKRLQKMFEMHYKYQGKK